MKQDNKPVNANEKFTKSGYIERWETWTPLPDLPSDKPKWDVAVAFAFRALARGDAQPHQQDKIVKWLMYASGVNGLPYVPGGLAAQRETTIAEGKQLIGYMIKLMLSVNLETDKQE